MRTQIKVFNPLQHVQNFTILQCTPLPLLKKITSSPWPLMVIPLALLPQDCLSQSTVSRTLRTLHPNQPCSSGGHPSKLSSRDQHAILSQIATSRAANATQVTKHINTIIPHPVSSETVRRVFRKHSFKAVVKKKKPFLSTRHRQQRLAFALKHREWTVEDWKRVIWSDETKINRFGSDGRQWVWK